MNQDSCQNGGFGQGYVPGGKRTTNQLNANNIIEQPIVVDFPVIGAGKLYIQTVTPNTTSLDGNLLFAGSFDTKPQEGSHMFVSINGIAVFPANGASEQFIKSFYIKDSTGTIVRPQGTFQIGDQFYWNGSIAGFQIESDDRVKLIYHI